MAKRQKKTTPAKPAAPVPATINITPKRTETSLARTGPSEMTPLSAINGPMAIVQQAVKEGASVEVLERLMGLQERWEATQARKAFDAAMAAVRKDLPIIVKSSKVDFTSDKGRTNYNYEDLATVVEAVSPVLTKHGLSFRWKTDNTPSGVTVTCIIAHEAGHQERTALTAENDRSGNKNSIQAIGSSVTYLQRYTLKAALGLAAAKDDDGLAARSEAKRAEPAKPVEHKDADKVITVGWKDSKTGEKHYGQLERLIAIQRKSGRSDEEVGLWLYRNYGYESRKEITRRHYDEIVSAIEAPGPLPEKGRPRAIEREPGEDDE